MLKLAVAAYRVSFRLLLVTLKVSSVGIVLVRMRVCILSIRA